VGKVTAVGMDTITEKSGHQMTGMAVSVCITPAAPSPLPIPYPTMGTVSEGIGDECMRTKIEGAKILTVGGVMKACHGNEAGTLKEVVSLNTAGPCFPALGAPTVLIELGMAGITGSLGQMNKSITVGGGGSASDAGGGGGGGGGAGGGAGGPGGGGPQGPSQGGGGGGGSNTGAAPPSPPAPPGAEGQAAAGHPVDVITGTMFTPPQVDFELPGPVWVAWTRHYRTSSVGERIGIGRGWSHSLAWRATLRDGVLALIDDTHREMTFRAPDADETLVLPFGRSVAWDGEALVVDLADGLVRVLERSTEPPRLRSGENNANFVLTRIRDRFDNSLSVAWDAGEVVGIVDSVGRRARLDRDARFKVWSIDLTDAEGATHTRHLVTYEIDEAGDLVAVTAMNGAVTRYRYDAEHYLVEEKRADELRFHFVYAEVGGRKRCVETWADLEGKDIFAEIGAGAGTSGARGLYHMRFEYGPGPHDATVIDPYGQRFRYKGNAAGLVEQYESPTGYFKRLFYGSLGQVVRTVTPDGSERRTYDAAGRLTSLTDAVGRSFSLGRREDGDITTVRDPVGAVYGVVSGRKGQMLERSDPRGATTKYAYDERGRVTAITAPDGTVETRSYDADSNLASRTTPLGAEWKYGFDLLGQLVRIEPPTGGEYGIEYDSGGHPVRVTAPIGTVEREFDGAGRLVAFRNLRGAVKQMKYVGHLVVEEVHDDGAAYRLTYDLLGRVTSVVNPAGERLTIERDAMGNVVRSSTFSGVHTTYEYDHASRVVRAVLATGMVKQFAYDATGRLVRREDDGVATTWLYDDRGMVCGVRRGATDVRLERDAAGNVVREEQRLGGWTFTVDHAIDARGSVVAKRYSTGWEARLARGPGAVLQKLGVESAEGAEGLAFDVDARGNEVARTHSSGQLVRTSRDADGKPERIELLGADGQVLRERRYRWSAGVVAEIVDSAAGRRSYELDAHVRASVVDGLGARERYRYDHSGTPIASPSTAVARAGRVVRTESASFAWDAAGRLASRSSDDEIGSWTYEYDGFDQLARATRGDGLSIQFHYDGFGRRVAAVQSDGRSTYFGWDQNAPVEEVASGGEHVRRVFADDEVTPLLESDGSSSVGTPHTPGRWRSVVCDWAATPWLMIDADGATAERDLGAHGAVSRSEGGFTALRFAGQRHDRLTGLSYQRWRYFSPEIGTFTSPDPLGIDASAFEVAFVPNVTAFIDAWGLAVLLMSDDPVCVNGANARARATGEPIVHYSQLGTVPNALAGESNLYIYGHGSPGQLHYADQNHNFTGATMSGQQLGNAIHGAGFRGSQIHMTVCEGGTDPPGQPGGSTAQSVANATGATTVGCVGAPMHDHPTVPGVTVAGPGGSMQPFTPSSHVPGVTSIGNARI